ncbi:MAG: hypothetical protein L0177_18995 [Chloroflexi bacterium]|nr:hypothetical protein [Chloroflexota bacterium]
MTLAAIAPSPKSKAELGFLRSYLSADQLEQLYAFADELLEEIVKPITEVSSNADLENLLSAGKVALDAFLGRYMEFIEAALKSRHVSIGTFIRKFNEKMVDTAEDLVEGYEGRLPPDAYHQLVMAVDDKRHLDSWLIDWIQAEGASSEHSAEWVRAEADAVKATLVFWAITTLLAERKSTPSLLILIRAFYAYITSVNRIMDGLDRNGLSAQGGPVRVFGYGFGKWEDESEEEAKRDLDAFLNEVREMRHQD